MARCVMCGIEAEQCPRCRNEQNQRDIRAILVKQIVEATISLNAANEKFRDVLNKFPSGLPHPDGAQQIRNASRHLENARKATREAHNRLSDFLERGAVPEDLKPSSPGSQRL